MGDFSLQTSKRGWLCKGVGCVAPFSSFFRFLNLFFFYVLIKLPIDFRTRQDHHGARTETHLRVTAKSLIFLVARADPGDVLEDGFAEPVIRKVGAGHQPRGTKAHQLALSLPDHFPDFEGRHSMKVELVVMR